MASELTVQTLRGPTSGANADTVLIPSGQTLHAPGHVIQTQTTVFTSTVNTTSGSYTSLISALITPKFASSRILIMAAIGGLYMNSNSGSNQHHWRMTRTPAGGSTVGVTGQNTNFHSEMGRGFTTAGMRANVNMNIIDTPNTTSQVAYDVQVSLYTGSGGIIINDTSATSTIILQEIAQ